MSNVTLNCLDVMNDSFAVQPRCSDITEKTIEVMNWIRVTAALVEFLVVAILLAYVLIRREYKSVLERLFIYLLLSTLLREAVLLSNVEYQFGYKQNDQVCSILGALNLYTGALVIIIVASTIIYLLRRVAYQKSNSAAFTKVFELGFISLTILVPLIFSAGLLYTDIFGLSTAWCWIREYDDQCQKTIPVKRILAGYGHDFVLIGILCTILIATIVIIYCKIARQVKQATYLLRHAFILLTFLIVYLAIAIMTQQSSNQKYIYILVVCIYDIYPLGFLISLRCQAVVSARKRRATYTRLPESILNASAPASERVSANSNTTPLPLEYTGEFTYIEPSQPGHSVM